MTLAADRAALATALAAAGADRVYATEPDAVEPSCLIVGNPAVTYDETFDVGYGAVWPIVLLVSRATDSQYAIAAIEPFMETTGTNSVRAALATVARARVVGTSNFGAGYVVGDVEYAGVTFEVQML